MDPKKRIGEMLLEAGIIDETQLKAALGHQRQWGVRLGQALVDLKLATEADIVRALSLKFGFDVAKLDSLEPYGHEQALKLFPREFAVRNNVLPMWADTANVTVAMSDPTNLAVVDEIRFRTGRRVKVCIGGDQEVAELVKRSYPGDAGVEAIALDLEADDASITDDAVFDPFGGGSKDALEAFYGGAAAGPDGAAEPFDPAPAPADIAPPAPAPQAAAVATAPAPPRPAAPQPRPAPRPAPTSGGLPAQGPAKPKAPAPAPAARPAPARNPTAAPPAAVPAARAATAPAAAAPTARPAAAVQPARPQRAPPAAAPAPARPRVGLDLERPPAAGRAPERAPAPAAGEPPREDAVLATDLAPRPPDADGEPDRDLSDRELAILESLDRLAGGAPSEPEVVKPTQAMAAMLRLLIRKRIVSEQEFLDELSKK
jgi:hypothetical protein